MSGRHGGRQSPRHVEADRTKEPLTKASGHVPRRQSGSSGVSVADVRAPWIEARLSGHEQMVVHDLRPDDVDAVVHVTCQSPICRWMVIALRGGGSGHGSDVSSL
jgi:hypothetical protein